ncbi:hypothetical protein NBO_11g0080 [Nosema bombycis CQ1]|uniref:Uncharacterized protein n=1 Tax=Nosema bombycis (strain CQ1 / CVCC 102059) TaxID=578461 RepID=R0MAM4_NOSB1|nr:hypothetical protein NBO_11g0080 [Nosema bombycis CQ1]|eukprot:EOB15009.1 hypothetical protein NBO_11g0080 [Nosema bombycis CQ1]
MNFFMMLLYYYVTSSASPNPNNLHGPLPIIEGIASSVARSTNSRPNTKPPKYSDLFDLNPPSYEKALEFEKNKEPAAIQINNYINDAGNIDVDTSAQLKLKEKWFLAFKSLVLALLYISVITMVAFIISKYA